MEPQVVSFNTYSNPLVLQITSKNQFYYKLVLLGLV